MREYGSNINLPSLDNLFSSEQERQDAKLEKIQILPLTELHPFRNHPFQVRDDDEMDKMVDSVKEYGVMTPAIVRPRKDGGYEIVAGHRRCHASQRAGVETKLNGPATEEAQAKQRMIEDAFKDWIFKDRERRESLVALYNEKFNCIRPREYDGSHIQFFGMNPEIALRPHQRNAIAHILYGHNTLLAHVVGAGKTYEMVAAAMEKKRLGLCSKTLVAVPNHLTGQFASEALKLYPNANILVTTQRDFEKTNRKRFCAKIATGNYDIVVIGHSQFEKIPLSDARKAEFIRKQIDELEMQLESMDNSESRLTVKQLESKKKQLKTKLSNLLDAPKRDDVVTFEELGADSLMVDEAHNFKNLMTVTKMHNIAGISTTESQKASDLFMKCQYLDEITGARGVTLACPSYFQNLKRD